MCSNILAYSYLKHTLNTKQIKEGNFDFSFILTRNDMLNRPRLLTVRAEVRALFILKPIPKILDMSNYIKKV